jgi:hypothetical protein
VSAGNLITAGKSRAMPFHNDYELMLRNSLITELRDTPPSRNRIRFYTSRGKDLCITGILRTGSGLHQSDHVVEAVLPCIVGAGFHASWKQASMHRGRRRPCIVS